MITSFIIYDLEIFSSESCAQDEAESGLSEMDF